MKWSTGKPRHVEAKEDFTELAENANGLLEKLILVEIFFPEDLSDRIFEFRKQISIIYDVYASQLATEYTLQEYVKKCNEEIREMRDKIRPIYDGIRKDLRKLLGVE